MASIITAKASVPGATADPPRSPPMTVMVPERSLPLTQNVTNVNIVDAVPMDDTMEMNPFSSSSPNMHPASDAPVLDVTPGNHPVTLPVTTPFSPGSTPTGRVSVSV